MLERINFAMTQHVRDPLLTNLSVGFDDPNIEFKKIFFDDAHGA